MSNPPTPKRKMNLTPTQRKALQERARRIQPWRHSTGPRTPKGKARTRQNALRHGAYAWATLPQSVQQYIVALEAAERGEGPIPPQEPLADLMMWGSVLPSGNLDLKLTIRCVTLAERMIALMWAQERAMAERRNTGAISLPGKAPESWVSATED